MLHRALLILSIWPTLALASPRAEPNFALQVNLGVVGGMYSAPHRGALIAYFDRLPETSLALGARINEAFAVYAYGGIMGARARDPVVNEDGTVRHDDRFANSRNLGVKVRWQPIDALQIGIAGGFADLEWRTQAEGPMHDRWGLVGHVDVGWISDYANATAWRRWSVNLVASQARAEGITLTTWALQVGFNLN